MFFLTNGFRFDPFKVGTAVPFGGADQGAEFGGSVGIFLVLEWVI